jgi:hypothetical protein
MGRFSSVLKAPHKRLAAILGGHFDRIASPSRARSVALLVWIASSTPGPVQGLSWRRGEGNQGYQLVFGYFASPGDHHGLSYGNRFETGTPLSYVGPLSVAFCIPAYCWSRLSRRERLALPRRIFVRQQPGRQRRLPKRLFAALLSGVAVPQRRIAPAALRDTGWRPGISVGPSRGFRNRTSSSISRGSGSHLRGSAGSVYRLPDRRCRPAYLLARPPRWLRMIGATAQTPPASLLMISAKPRERRSSPGRGYPRPGGSGLVADKNYDTAWQGPGRS